MRHDVNPVRRHTALFDQLLFNGFGVHDDLRGALPFQAVAETESEVAPLGEGEEKLAVESVIAVEGTVVSETQAPGGYELHNLQIEVITPVHEVPVVPINKRKIAAQLSTLLDHAVVTNRHPQRRAILRLFSGTLEFNNLFTSYKGEGTGAVRHMFSHHVLKPERIPIEANDRATGVDCAPIACEHEDFNCIAKTTQNRAEGATITALPGIAILDCTFRTFINSDNCRLPRCL